MSTIELKSDLHNLIDKVNDNTILRAIQMLLKKNVKEDIVGFDAKGNSLTLKLFIKRIEKAEAEVKKGKYISIDQLEKESDSW